MKQIELNYSVGTGRYLHIYADGVHIEKDNPKFAFVYSYVSTSQSILDKMNIPYKWDGNTQVYVVTPIEFAQLSQKLAEKLLLNQANEIARQQKVAEYVMSNMNYVMPELISKLKELNPEKQIEVANDIFNERQHFNQTKYFEEGEEGWMPKWWAFQKNVLNNLNAAY